VIAFDKIKESKQSGDCELNIQYSLPHMYKTCVQIMCRGVFGIWEISYVWTHDLRENGKMNRGAECML
jgi:hypothetical protein